MRDRDTILLEQAYQSILIERVYGNIAVVYHRKASRPEDSVLFTKGIGGANREGAVTSNQTQSEIKRSVYGTGLYACYDFNSQLKREMAETYGEYVVKGKLDLNNFFFLDQQAFEQARPGQSFIEHLDSLKTTGKRGEPGFKFYEFDTFKQRVREHKLTKTDAKSLIDVSLEIWPYVKNQKFDGLMYLNEFDGKVAVIYNRASFLPFQYGYVPVKEIKRLLALPPEEREKAVQWTTKMPDIHNIKRKEELSYDADLQKQSARDILMFNTTKQTVVPFLNLDLVPDLSNAHFPYIKQCSGEIRLIEYRRDNRPVRLSIPNLVEAFNISLSLLKDGSSIDFRSLQIVKRQLVLTISGSVELPSLENCGERLWINNPQSDYTPKELVSLPKLKTCAQLVIDKTNKIDLRSLQSCKGGIHAPECVEIILPDAFRTGKKPKMKLSKNVEFIWHK